MRGRESTCGVARETHLASSSDLCLLNGHLNNFRGTFCNATNCQIDLLFARVLRGYVMAALTIKTVHNVDEHRGRNK